MQQLCFRHTIVPHTMQIVHSRGVALHVEQGFSL